MTDQSDPSPTPPPYDYTNDYTEETSLSQQAMTNHAKTYLDGLNTKQEQAVKTLDGPLLLLAGAGTGKTRALTTRIAHLIMTGRARPNQILAVTFTNKAAREMKTRIGTLLGQGVEGMPWMGTFHSVCAKILRSNAEVAGLQTSFTILDKDDQLRLLKQILRAENIDEKLWPPRLMASLIDGWKNRALLPDTVPQSDGWTFNGHGPRIYGLYQSRLKTLNACDFGDLLLHVVEMFKKHPEILAKYQDYFRYILVDEYQDTNIAQYMWLRLLAATHHNICCVGDDDQSIYGWRGAEVGNILRFETDFKGAKIIRLEQNYRSTPHILAAAGALISTNKTRLGKELWTQQTDGEKLRLIHLPDSIAESRWIGEQIEDLQAGRGGHERTSLEDIAILVRASHQMRAFEDRFVKIGLPYRVIGGPRFYERLEIRDALAYFRLVVSPQDGLAFERIINTPKRGLGDKTLQKISQTARAADVSLLQGAEMVLNDGVLAKKASDSLRILLDKFDRWTMLLKETMKDAEIVEDEEKPKDEHKDNDRMSHVDLAEIILDESGYMAHWKNDPAPDSPGRLENLKELVGQLSNFENFSDMLEHVSLVMDNDAAAGEEKVSIMTMHAAKGLEFPVVFLPGWEEDLFPSKRTLEEDAKRKPNEDKTKGLEEERRLAYVGITRAERLCLISFVSSRQIYRNWQTCYPSQFIDELPRAHVNVLECSSNYGNRVYDGMRRNTGANTGDSIVEDMGGNSGRNSGGDRPYSPYYNNRNNRHNYYPRGRPQKYRDQNGRQEAVIIEGKTAPIFGLNDAVIHPSLGAGTVVGVEAEKVSVIFTNGKSAKVMANYLTMGD